MPEILASLSSHNSWLPLKYSCFLNLLSGTQYTKGEHVYPEFNTSQEWTGFFPDGTPFTTTMAQKPRFIFVWKTWGKTRISVILHFPSRILWTFQLSWTYLWNEIMVIVAHAYSLLLVNISGVRLYCFIIRHMHYYIIHSLLSEGRYWQVAGGPSSALTIGTDNVPLGSYNMEVVIYHCRGKDRFIPLGYTSTQFSITGVWVCVCVI